MWTTKSKRRQFAFQGKPCAMVFYRISVNTQRLLSELIRFAYSQRTRDWLTTMNNAGKMSSISGLNDSTIILLKFSSTVYRTCRVTCANGRELKGKLFSKSTLRSFCVSRYMPKLKSWDNSKLSDWFKANHVLKNHTSFFLWLQERETTIRL